MLINKYAFFSLGLDSLIKWKQPCAVDVMLKSSCLLTLVMLPSGKLKIQCNGNTQLMVNVCLCVARVVI